MAEQTIQLRKSRTLWRIDALDPQVAVSGQQGIGGIGSRVTLGGYLLYQGRESEDPWVRERAEAMLASPLLPKFAGVMVDANSQLHWNSEGTWWRTGVEVVDEQTDLCTYTRLAPGFLIAVKEGAMWWTGGSAETKAYTWDAIIRENGLRWRYLQVVQGVKIGATPTTQSQTEETLDWLNRSISI